jgi:ubiquinone/menaquinone biosynthesis C-methylase UbiE
MSKAHEKLIADQFGPRAKAYVESAVHSQGEDLAALAGIVEQAAPVHAIDLGAGGGHVSYLMAKYAKSVTALDLSSEMLAAVTATAKEKGLANIATAQGGAERLPFEDAAFDFVASRFSAHHWRDFEQGLGEARRVAKAGSPAVFIDVFAPGRAMLDTHLQAVELLRDGSHVRDYTAAEWLGALGRRGFLPRACRSFRLHMDFPVWIARMNTPEDRASAILTLQASAPAEVKQYFGIEEDGSFWLDVLMMETVAG